VSTRGYRFHPAARQELDSAVERYDQELPGLGLDFLDAVEHSIHSIVERPAAWQCADTLVAGQEIRRFVMARFPFSIVYYVADDVVRIVAVAHGRKKPGYWRSRASHDL
jgi:plasmid stabilization system protein ParE